ncbi:hypothetical protein MMC14_000577 [Varicellaria rhodocarpa]|nr:hypothetical protein [Varicellaria rhodocarpa]
MRALELLLIVVSFAFAVSSALVSARPPIPLFKDLESHDQTHTKSGISARSLVIEADTYVRSYIQRTLAEPYVAAAHTPENTASSFRRPFRELIHLEEPTNLRLRSPPGYPSLPGVSPPILSVFCDEVFRTITGPALSRLLTQAINLVDEQLRLHPLGVLSEDGFHFTLDGYGIDILPRNGQFLNWSEVARTYVGILNLLTQFGQFELSRWHLRK